MKAVGVVASLLLLEVVLGAVPNQILSSPEADMWKAWKGKYNKEYETIAEEVARFNIWKDMLKEVSLHNVEADLGMHTYRTSMNEFADMTPQEFTSQKKGLIQKDKNRPLGDGQVMTSKVKVPSSVDWRVYGYVTPVKDQGQCGSCWSFSTTGVLEGYHFNATGKLVSLSEQDFVSCDTTDYGCNGGWPYDAIEFASRYGAISESDYPYVSGNGYVPSCQNSGKAVAATVNGYRQLAKGDENNLKTASSVIGPISICIDASHRSFQSYSSGVYYEPYCSSYSLDHAVLLAGYGTENGQDYWLVKNSWGTSWGEQGYVKMARNKNNNCGVASEPVYAY